MARAEWFDASVTLPSGLTRSAIGRSVEYIERELSGLVDIYYEQMNVFSALVSIFGAKGLDSFSDYEKHRHSDTAQQRPSWVVRSVAISRRSHRDASTGRLGHYLAGGRGVH